MINRLKNYQIYRTKTQINKVIKTRYVSKVISKESYKEKIDMYKELFQFKRQI